jgi:hypothetical protein
MATRQFDKKYEKVSLSGATTKLSANQTVNSSVFAIFLSEQKQMPQGLWMS